MCCPGRPLVSCAPSGTITARTASKSTDRIAHFSGLGKKGGKPGCNAWLYMYLLPAAGVERVSLVSLGRHGAATARLQMGAVPREPEQP